MWWRLTSRLTGFAAPQAAHAVGQDNSEKPVVAFLVRAGRVTKATVTNGSYQPTRREMQQGAARFVQLVSVEVSAKSQQKYAKCQHRNAPPRNKTQQDSGPERWAFSACWLTKTEQDVTKEKAGIQAGIRPKRLL